MIEEIKDGFENLKDTLGDNGFMFLMIGAVAFGLYNLLKSSDSSEDEGLQVANAYASYPDVDTNANVIMDSINNTIDSSTTDIIGTIESSTSEVIETSNENKQEILDTLNEQDEKTSDYVNEGTNRVHTVYVTMSPTEETHGKGHISMPGIRGGETKKLKETSVTKKKPTNSATKKKQSNSTTKKTSSSGARDKKPPKAKSTYTYKTKSGLNTSTSIVDALKATGVNSSFSNREKIAKANGIKNYTGSASQNVTLLNKLKNGSLKKV